MTKISNIENDRDTDVNLGRRTFLSTAAVGAAFMLSPNIAVASDLENSYISPSPADSLTFYLDLLDEIRSELMMSFVKTVAERAAEVRRSYKTLAGLVADLEKEAPELKSGSEVSNLRNVTKVGIASASQIKPVMINGAFQSASFVEMISVSTNSLSSSADELDRKSLKLSPKAVEILKEILQEIRRQDTLSSKLVTATDELKANVAGISSKIDGIRKSLTSAIAVFVRDELKAAGSTVYSNEGRALIKDAATKLKELESFSAGQSPDSNSGTTSVTPTKNAFLSQADPTAVLLLSLLEDTVGWISAGGQIPDLVSSRKNNDVEFMTVSTNRRSSGFGLFWNVRRILADSLPEATTSRAWICIALIGPILIAGRSANSKEEKIYALIPHLRPKGNFDFNDSQRRRAAQMLANL